MPKGANYNPGKTEVTIFCKDTLGHTGILAGLNACHGGAEVTNRRDKRRKIDDWTDNHPHLEGFFLPHSTCWGSGPPQIVKSMFFCKEYSWSSVEEVIVQVLLHSETLRNDSAALCQRWVSIGRIIQEKNDVELGCWKKKLGWRTEPLGWQFLYNSLNSFRTFLSV